MKKNLPEILTDVSSIESKVRDLQDTILSNLVMISEIPSATFKEQKRMNFLVNRFAEYELLNCSTDEMSNALGIYPGEVGDHNILVVAHMDSLADEKLDPTIAIQPDIVRGPGVGDNALGLAAMTTLPLILDALDIKLQSNLILMGSARSLGRGNIEGLRFFLENTRVPIEAGVCVEGCKLGRMSISSLGMLRGEITYQIPDEYDWTRFGAGGAIVNINEIITKMLEIPIPKKPMTSISMGSVRSGSSFNKVATKATLRFEVRSESDEMVEKLKQNISFIVAEMASRTGANVNFDILARRKPGGLDFSHPLATSSMEILKKLGVHPRLTPSTSELSAFIDKDIPAVTIGLTSGENMGEPDEFIEIEPIYKGIAQLLGILLAIDGGYNHGS